MHENSSKKNAKQLILMDTYVATCGGSELQLNFSLKQYLLLLLDATVDD